MGSKSEKKMSKIRNKIQKRKYCRFYLVCKLFYPESFTCCKRGGDYCGRYRSLEAELIV